MAQHIGDTDASVGCTGGVQAPEGRAPRRNRPQLVRVSQLILLDGLRPALNVDKARRGQDAQGQLEVAAHLL
jgi:hypothetical protein